MNKIIYSIIALSLFAMSSGCDGTSSSTSVATPKIKIDATGSSSSASVMKSAANKNVSNEGVVSSDVEGLFSCRMDIFAYSYEPGASVRTANFPADYVPASGNWSWYAFTAESNQYVIKNGDIEDVSTWAGNTKSDYTFTEDYIKANTKFDMDVIMLVLNGNAIISKEHESSPDAPTNYCTYGYEGVIGNGSDAKDALWRYSQYTMPTLLNIDRDDDGVFDDYGSDPIYRKGCNISAEGVSLTNMTIMFINKDLCSDISRTTLVEIRNYTDSLEILGVTTGGATYNLIADMMNDSAAVCFPAGGCIVIPYDVKSVAIDSSAADGVSVFKSPTVSVKFDLSNVVASTNTWSGFGTLSSAIAGNVDINSNVANGVYPFGVSISVTDSE